MNNTRVADATLFYLEQLNRTTAEWEPIFEPDAAMLSGIGDGAIKLNQAVPDYIDERRLRKLTGI